MRLAAVTSACRMAVVASTEVPDLIRDDRVIKVDQVVGRIGEEGVATLGAGPTRRWIGRRDKLRRDRRGGAERGIVEDGEILIDRPPARCRRGPLIALDPALPIGVGPDQAAIDSKTFAPNQALLDAAMQNRLEHAP